MADGRHRPDVSENKERHALLKNVLLELTWPPSSLTNMGGEVYPKFRSLIYIPKIFHATLFFLSFFFFLCVCVFILIWKWMYFTIYIKHTKKIEEKKRFFPDYSAVCIISVFLFIFSTNPRLGSGQPTPFSCLGFFCRRKKKVKIEGDLPTHGGRSRDTLTEGKLSLRFHFSL